MTMVETPESVDTLRQSIEQIEHHFKTVDQFLSRHHERFDEVERRLGAIETRVEELDRRFLEKAPDKVPQKRKNRKKGKWTYGDMLSATELNDAYRRAFQSAWRPPESPPDHDGTVLLAIQWRADQARDITLGCYTQDRQGNRTWCLDLNFLDKNFDVLAWMPLPRLPDIRNDLETEVT